MLYAIKPVHLELFGDEANTDTLLNDADIEMIARGWGESIETVKDLLDECVPICMINLPDGTGKQTIYWNMDKETLVSELDPYNPCAFLVETRREANVYAGILWGFTDWNLEWIK